ncbi:LLM class flavin-dependent oxidoreductase [Tardiphaga sp. 866_E4_N2_1]|uniref:LLM class flavin-dependent oxidoreductase n=1 Tax=unclassified Tardiphaga TaxID=2631404 RepID=UPI003F228E96
MRAYLFHEAICPEGVTWPVRYAECVEEAVLAEAVGFDGYSASEQHFANGEAITTAPEILLAYVAARTSRIRLRIASVNFLPFNHPIRVAEQMGTLNILSNGRAELGGARSNNPYTLDGFGVNPALTREYRDEHLNIFGQIMKTGAIEYQSDLYKIPKRRVSPVEASHRPIPVHLSATSIDSHEEAGAMGVGVMSGLSILGWDYVQTCIDAYNKGAERAEPVAGSITRRQALFSVGVNCHADRAVARAATEENTLRFIEVIMDWMTKLAKRSDNYEYFAQIERIRSNMRNLDYLIESAPYIMAGNPDDVIASCRRLYEMGIDDVLWRVDGMGHDANKAALEMLGKHVLPELHSWSEHKKSTPAPVASLYGSAAA